MLAGLNNHPSVGEQTKKRTKPILFCLSLATSLMARLCMQEPGRAVSPHRGPLRGQSRKDVRRRALICQARSASPLTSQQPPSAAPQASRPLRPPPCPPSLDSRFPGQPTETPPKTQSSKKPFAKRRPLGHPAPSRPSTADKSCSLWRGSWLRKDTQTAMRKRY